MQVQVDVGPNAAVRAGGVQVGLEPAQNDQNGNVLAKLTPADDSGQEPRTTAGINKKSMSEPSDNKSPFECVPYEGPDWKDPNRFKLFGGKESNPDVKKLMGMITGVGGLLAGGLLGTIVSGGVFSIIGAIVGFLVLGGMGCGAGAMLENFLSTAEKTPVQAS